MRAGAGKQKQYIITLETCVLRAWPDIKSETNSPLNSSRRPALKIFISSWTFFEQKKAVRMVNLRAAADFYTKKIIIIKYNRPNAKKSFSLGSKRITFQLTLKAKPLNHWTIYYYYLAEFKQL